MEWVSSYLGILGGPFGTAVANAHGENKDSQKQRDLLTINQLVSMSPSLCPQEKYILDTHRLQRENASCSAWGFADYSQRVRNQRVQINFGFTPHG